jgi:hypothetical protein
MSTRSCVSYEKENGDYVGCYCHYYGYPEHMIPNLIKFSYKDIVKNVDYGIANGGIKYISKMFEFYEEPSDSTCWGYDHLPFRSQFSYVYVVKKDGTILHYNYDGKKQWWLNGEIYGTKEDWFDALSDEAKSKCLFSKDFLNE